MINHLFPNQMEGFFPYEGAGFLLFYEDDCIMGIRVKKPEDLAKDPIVEIEYFGGKPEPEDGNDPLQTAFAEGVEETGINFLDSDWRTRVTPLHIFQPFSKKWIWASVYKLNDAEYNRLLVDPKWTDDSETRDFSCTTGRKSPARRALSAIVRVSYADLLTYIAAFADTEKSANRLKDAKEFRAKNVVTVTNIRTGENGEYPLRAFNLVMFESKLSEIKELLL